MLGTGSAMMIGGVALAASEDSYSNLDSGIAVFAIGIPVTLASIPFFIIAKKNNKRANLSLKGESISLKYIPVEKSNYVALSLTIPLGK